MEAVQAFEAQSNETGDSRATLKRYGMVRAELQPEFAALAPERAVAAICSETGAPDDQSCDLLGVFAIDGAVVVRNGCGYFRTSGKCLVVRGFGGRRGVFRCANPGDIAMSPGSGGLLAG